MEDFDFARYQCWQCPYCDQEAFRHRYELYLKYGEPQFDCCWCDKVGGQMVIFGHCEDAFEEPVAESSKQSDFNRGRGYNYRKQAKRAEFNRVNNTPDIYTTNRFVSEDDNGNEYVKLVGRNNYKRFCKRMSRRKIRRSDIDFVGKGNLCNKYFDYWWNVL